ncbi:MAG: glycosyltransferase [Flavobacteriales bacterium]|nr:glycosyltransferase [Flavobacteriales bacterium]
MHLLIILVSVYMVFLLYVITPSIKSHGIQSQKSESQSISLVIPFKDEERNLPNLIDSILEQDIFCMSVEFIFVDDHSTDASQSLIRKIQDVRLISAIDHGKKNAIRQGVQAARFDWILTLDADVCLSPNFFQELANVSFENRQMLLFSMRPIRRRGFISAFFDLEFLALQGVGIGMAEKNRPLLSNGACLLFKKEAFFMADKQRNDYAIPTGDDIFGMFAIIKEYGKKSIGTASWVAPVNTLFPSNFFRLFAQRARWISKTTNVDDFQYQFVAILMAIIHLLPVLLMMGSFGGVFSWYTVLPVIFIKLASEWFFFWHLTTQYHRGDLLFWLPLTQLLYPFYIFILIAYGLRYRLQFFKPSLDAV